MYPCTRTWNGAGQKTAKTAPAWSSPGGGGMLLGGGEDATCPYESSPRYVAGVCRWRMGMWAREEYTRVRGRFIGHRVLSEGDRPEGEHWGRNMKFRAIRGEVSSFLSPSVWRQTIERRCSERNRARLRLRYLIICREAFLIPSGNCRGGRREEERGDNKSFAVTLEGMMLFSLSFLLFQSSDRFNRSILPSSPPGRGWESRLQPVTRVTIPVIMRYSWQFH